MNGDVMKHILRFGLLIVCGLMMLPTLAQDDTTETHEFEDTLVMIEFPSTFELTEADDGYIDLSSDTIMIQVYDSVALDNAFEFTSADSVDDALIELVPQLLGDIAEFDENEMTVEDNMARFAVEVDDDNTLIIIAVMTADEQFGILQSLSPSDELEDHETLITDLLSGFNPDDESSASCSVSTSESNSIEVRVGPGTNRTVVSFLPANTPFDILGKIEADDESLWFKLDKELAAPGKSVNETWVSAENVTQDGDCDIIGDASAPPIIPITTSSGSASDDGGEFIMPTIGSWTMGISNISSECPVEDSLLSLFESETQTLNLSDVSPSSITLDGDVFPAIATNTYGYSEVIPIQDDVTMTASATLTVTSETSMTGTISFTTPVCSESATISVTLS
jgi:hypothetical protein